MGSLLVKYNCRDAATIDIPGKKILDVSGNNNHGTLININQKDDRPNGSGLYIPLNGAMIECNNVFKPNKSYTVAMNFLRYGDTWSDYGTSNILLTTRDSKGSVGGLMMYLNGSGGKKATYDHTSLQIWDWGIDTNKTISTPNMNALKNTVTNTYTTRFIINADDGTATIQEKGIDMKHTGPFKYTIANSWSRMTIGGGYGSSSLNGWLFDIEIHEGIVDVDLKLYSLLMDSEGKLYTITPTNTLEVVATESTLTAELMINHGKAIYEFNRVKNELKLNQFKVVTLNI